MEEPSTKTETKTETKTIKEENREENKEDIESLSAAVAKFSINKDEMVCPVCQDVAVHPVTLPCTHTFCYLCLKGVFARRGTCALCREPIPSEAVSKPNYPSSNDSYNVDDSVRWLYQAKDGGWWLYEQRLIDEIEKAYTNQKHKLEVQISGFMYVIDLKQMVQYRAEKPNRQRKIKRQTTAPTTSEYKGVAGILIKKDE